jgi:hypothetical protein
MPDASERVNDEPGDRTPRATPVTGQDCTGRYDAGPALVPIVKDMNPTPVPDRPALRCGLCREPISRLHDATDVLHGELRRTRHRYRRKA